MAASQHSSSSTSPSQGSVDPIDIDSFIKFEALSYQSPSISPTLSRSQSNARSISSVNPNNTLLPPDSTQTFSGPSHQYGSYKQQTGLPAGALSSTHAMNQSNNFFRSAGGFGSSFDMGKPEEVLDFNSIGINENDMDYELQTMMMSNNDLGLSSSSDFIDPSVLGSQDPSAASSSTMAPSQPSNVGRLYPGAHQQQAALAKQQQQARHANQQTRSSRINSTDPIAEKKISQLLKSMRQSSVSTSLSDDDHRAMTGHTSLRVKKDEEDMDEDERLLASEEGKKLSSKERRQLRNKVSARAFRSRRKEYIGQLEGEINSKTNEISDLRMQNKALMDENTRLTDLTRMLLSSPSFSTFLDEMSSEGLLTAPQPAQAQQAEPSQPAVPKDTNPYSVSQQTQGQDHNGPMVGMTLIQDNAMDLLAPMNGGSAYNNWATNQPQVFSVMELPEGPSVDTACLSGKSGSEQTVLSSMEAKVEAPIVERPSQVAVEATASTDIEEVEWDESDPAFALFIDTPNTVECEESSPVQLFGMIPIEKALSRLELVTEEPIDPSEDVSAQSMEKLERICAYADSVIQRVQRIAQ